jgi:hypothetical protein
MTRIFGAAMLSTCLLVLSLMAGTAHASAVTLPHAQHWNTVSPWSRVYSGSALDGSVSAPGSASTSLKFTYPKGHKGGIAPDKVWVSFSQTQELWAQYYFKYSSNWTRNGTNDKQCYFQLSTGGNFFLGVGKWGGSKFFMEWQPTSGSSGNRFSNTGYNPTIVNNVWYKVTMRAVLNTPGVANGIIQIWIDDKLLMDQKDINYRGASQGGVGINSMEFTPVWGGGSTESKPATDFFWVAHTIISTNPIKSGNSSPSPPPPDTGGKSPRPPSNMKIGK